MRPTIDVGHSTMIYFASDIHLGGGDVAAAREREQRFVAWLDSVSADAEAIVLVGDLFDFWFEYKRVVPQGFVRTLGRLADFTDRGVRVIFFTGNHDMWLDGYLASECGIEVYTKPQVLNLGGLDIFIAHGDNMNIGGQPVLLLLNTIFRSKSLRWIFSRFIHPDLAMRFGLWWSSHSRRSHNIAGGFNASLTASLDRFARDYQCDHGIDNFVFGHMHFPCELLEGDLRVIHLGGWEQIPSCGVIDGDGGLTLKILDQ